MELLANLGSRLPDRAARRPTCFYCFVGVFLGTLIGVLPGLGPTATIAMLLPITFALPPVSALIMLAGIYYGSQYGGSTTSILVNLPGEASSVVTALDGYQMARQGRAGAALATAAHRLVLRRHGGDVPDRRLRPRRSRRVALQFGPAEYFSLMVLGLVASVVLAQGSLLHALGMVVLGLLLGLVGTDVTSGAPRFTFEIPELADGIGFVIVAMGMFGLGEIVRNLEHEDARRTVVTKITRLMPTARGLEAHGRADPARHGDRLGCWASCRAAARSWGPSPPIPSRRRSPSNRAEFGKGAIEGVAAPESANNAGAQTSFIPMLTLGIPSNPVMALMIGAMIIQGIQPGPVGDHGAAGAVLGNHRLDVDRQPVPGGPQPAADRPLGAADHGPVPPALSGRSWSSARIGVFSLNNSEFDVYLMALFGVLGYVFAKLGCEPAPMLLGFILGPMMEEYLRRAMLLSRGNPWVFVQRPISATLLALAALAMCAVLLPAFGRTRKEAF